MLKRLALFIFAICVTARPPTADEVKDVREQTVDSKDDYDLLPSLEYVPESFKESLKKQKMRYLELLKQNDHV